MDLIPIDYTEFLYWLKANTEKFWSKQGVDNDYLCADWMYGAKWIGMSDDEIDSVQEKFAITFMPEHREFLRVLHTIDRKRRVYIDDEDPESEYTEYPFYVNWLGDESEVKRAIEWPYTSMLKSIIDDSFWMRDKWGEFPETHQERKDKFRELFLKAPKILPIGDTKYQVSDFTLSEMPILSVRRTDIILYDTNFRNYLLKELAPELDIYHLEYNKEIGDWCWVMDKEYENYFYNSRVIKEWKIPFWRDFL